MENYVNMQIKNNRTSNLKLMSLSDIYMFETQSFVRSIKL